MSFLRNLATAAVAGAATAAAASAIGAGASGLMSALRSKNLPLNAESFSPKEVATAQSGSDGDPKDWRVRLGFPSSVMPYVSSNLFKPLRDSGGLIFPYTPTITISSQANYTETPLTHHNFQFVSYQGSRVSEISVSGDFFVEDAVQAQYWLSVVHFLRSATKMFTGDSSLAGNPPIILYFNAYGDYVFKDVPVVVKSFSMTLPKEVDYITTNIENPPSKAGGGFGAGDPTNAISDMANKIAGVTSAAGLTQAANTLRNVGNVANLISGGLSMTKPKSIGSTGSTSSSDDSHVPTQSTLNVSLLPVYSRTRIRKFNLETFINGGYVKDGFI
jgi:hypothetical protein